MHVQSNGGWLGGWLGGRLGGWLAGRPKTPPPPRWLAQLPRLTFGCEEGKQVTYIQVK